MGTSNWQQIPFCIDALMKIEPTSVLDVGVGFGRWGIITREFCEVWFSRVFKDQWKVRVEGIEAFPRNIADYHASFYDAIHVGDAAELLPTLAGPWSVVIFGDVLEHFVKEKAVELLRLALDRSDYVLVNIPIGEDFEQGEAYGNPFERHRSRWWPDDFRPFGLIRHVMLRDYVGRPYGSFVLSRNDPRNLEAGLFSTGRVLPDPRHHPGEELDRLAARVRELRHELAFTKNGLAYKIARRVRDHPIVRAARAALCDRARTVVIDALGRPGHDGSGTEVWLLGVQSEPADPGIPWDHLHFRGAWTRHDADARPFGRCFMTRDGSVAVRTGPDPVVTLMTHPDGGLARIAFAGRSRIVDLSSATVGQVVIRPANADTIPVETRPDPPGRSAIPVVAMPPAQILGELSPAERGFLDAVRGRPDATVAVHCPKWLGVSASTRTLFPDTYPVPADPSIEPSSLTMADVEHHARVLAHSDATRVVFSGGDESHLEIALRLRELRPQVAVDLFWHGSYHQIGEEYAWRILKRWMRAVKQGRVRSILTCKAGMEDFFRSAGIPSALLLNHLPGDVLDPPPLPARPLHAGLWLSGHVFRKAPYAMICAMRMVGDVTLHGAGLDPAAIELVEVLGLPVEDISESPLPRDSLVEAMRRTHVSLYVTLSECCPMLPLESLQAGVPCLIGPNSHLFEDNPFLHDRLVVPYPDRADVIARHFLRAVEERESIIAEYARYAPVYGHRALESVRRWLADGPTPAPASRVHVPATA